MPPCRTMPCRGSHDRSRGRCPRAHHPRGRCPRGRCPLAARLLEACRHPGPCHRRMRLAAAAPPWRDLLHAPGYS
eukprot:7381649-Prymnesium_polylepis.3